MIPTLPKRQSDVTVTPQKVEIVLSETGAAPLSVVMPPLEDLSQMRELASADYSVSAASAAMNHDLAHYFDADFKHLNAKADSFSNSVTFLNRLANLASLTGDLVSEGNLIGKALALSQDSFFCRKRAENFFSLGRSEEARAVLSGMDLKHDIYANLRLASMHVAQNELAMAEESVEQALECDPLDFGARLFEGGLKVVRGEFEKALFSFRVAEDANPRSCALFTNKAIAYSALGRFDKALRSLKRAVALDPLNTRAVSMLSDVAFHLEEDDEALPSLLYYTQMESNNVAIWRRAARASFRLGKFTDAIHALKREGAILQSSGLWNNLGVAYERNREGEKALQAFMYAFKFSEPRDEGSMLAARNIAQFLDVHHKSSVLTFLEPLIYGQEAVTYRKHPIGSDIFAFALGALRREGKNAAAIDLAFKLLENGDIADRLAVWIVGNLVSELALQGGNSDAINKLIFQYSELADRSQPVDAFRREMFFNNVAFAFAEMDEIVSARKALDMIKASVRKSAYPTATLGLINFRSGNLERGTELYEAAIQLATSASDKARIRQKLNLELARFIGNDDLRKTTRLLERVAKQKDGERMLVTQARKLLERLEESARAHRLQNRAKKDS